MTMQRALVLVGLIAVFSWPLAAQQRDRDPEMLFQSALYKEQVELKLDDAIAGYQAAIAAAGTNKSIAAKALLQMAGCYERLGNPEAAGAYRRLTVEFSETASASTARTRLALLEQKSKGIVLEQLPELSGRFGRFITPDGKFVTFTDSHTNNIGIHEFETGKERLITTEGKVGNPGIFGQWPFPSPDGRLIAYSWFTGNPGGFEIRVVSKDGGQPRVVYQDTEKRAGTPAGWTPDGKWILTFVGTNGGGVPLEMVLLPVDGGPKKVIKRYAVGDNGGARDEARMSRDGRFVAYSKSGDVTCISVATGAESQLTDHPARDRFLAWVPDNQRILFQSDRKGSWGLWSLAVRECQPIGEAVLLHSSSEELWAQGFSRSGDFYFTTYPGNGTMDEVYVANIDPATGRQTVALVRLPGRLGHKSNAAWSMDGQRIVHLQSNPSAVAVREVASGVVRTFDPLLGPLPFAAHPGFLPDGNIVLRGWPEAAERASLYTLNAATGAVAPLGIDAFPAAVSKDGRLFTSGPAGIQSWDLATKNNRVVDRDGGTLALSPDGEWLAVLRSNEKVRPANVTERRLTVLPSIGGTARSLDAINDWVVGGAFAWSADGKHIFVVREGLDSQRAGVETPVTIWQVPVDGSAPMNTGIVSDGRVNRLSAHPDGKRLLISATRPTKSRTWVLKNLPAK